VTVLYLDLTDYLAIAAEVTGIDSKTLARITKLEMADSALHAPDAGWGDDDLYPDFVDKAAVLIFRLTNNHPLPDGNKRAAWVSLRVFIELNRWVWSEYPSTDQAENAVMAIASGDWDETRVSSWLSSRLRPPEEPAQ
jgi:death-on-curing protein